ncbi:EAL domain-containing protein [Exilibacterium tricleocarpae]|uniref:EAL domain-containing protein n=1 Tax=Exilibacterium tricleocarpae TaxID=2591008 RepID=A0A545T835_9GAMM|nr:EAL domain-containing protein [Exilibacterium tricleocarpae]TQV73389.1 EAL domain-containing protein [Exilibacterium tricleocarpae]
MSRRTDNQLRSAIAAVERMLLTEPSATEVLSRCLSQLMELFGAAFGYVYQCRDSDGDAIPWELVGCYRQDSGVLQEVENTCTSDRMPAAVQPRLLSGRCLFDNDIGDALNPVPHDHPQITNCFCIPLVDACYIHAVLYLCNVDGGFDAACETRIRPFIAAANCLLRAAKKRATVKSLTLADTPEFSLEFLDALFNGVLVINDMEEVVMCNSAAASMLGIPRTEVIGAPLKQFMPKGAPLMEQRLIEHGTGSCAETSKCATVWRGVTTLRANGDKILVDLSAFELRRRDQVLRGLVMNDISERMKSATEYHSTLQRFQVLTNLAPVGILQLNRNWQCTYANDTWCEYCQMTPAEAKGTGWMQGLHIDDVDRVLDSLRSETTLSGAYEGEFRLQSPLGKIVWVKANACSLYEETGETSGLIMTFNDVTDHLNNERRLQEIAEKDQLTGLINRAFFNDRLELALTGIERFGSVVLMFLDLDEFKLINDTLGHDVGDQLLKEVADRLRTALRKADTIARLGGDEFTLVLTNVQNLSGITAVADKAISALNQPFVIGERRIYVTGSIGIAVAQSKETTTKVLLKQADVALYKAKEAGRNQYKFYTAELDKDADLHIHLRQSLKERSRRDFRVVYQPQVDAVSGKIVGLEALTRWRHPDADDVSPEKFIKMIEESGLISEFSEWLFEEIFSTITSWKRAKGPIPISINLSAKQFRNKNLAFYIHQCCLSHGIEPNRIVLEVTETALIDDPGLAAATLKELRKMGFSLSLDDFGTGYSSLACLRDMPLQYVKIDRSFTKDVMDDESDRKIVSAIINLAEALDLKVVAEGVDNLAVKEWLLQHNCNYQQGFYFYQPLERASIEKLLDIAPYSDAVVHLDSGTG